MLYLGPGPKEIPPEAWLADFSRCENFHMSPPSSRSPLAHLENGVIASFLAHLAEGRVGVKAAWGRAGPRKKKLWEGSPKIPHPQPGFLLVWG